MKKLFLSILVGSLLISFGYAGPAGLSSDGQKQVSQDVIATGPTTCPVENTLYGQEPVTPEDSWNAYTSAVFPNGEYIYLVTDDFPGIPDPICDIHWWGLRLAWDSGWYECYEDPMPFYINFWYHYTDSVPVCSYDLPVSVVDTGIMYSDYYFFYFSVDLDPCCYMPNGGWLTLQSHGDCVFLWMISGEGNGMQHDGAGWNDLYSDLAFCLTGADGTEVEIPRSIQLNQNYPNPFNPTTTIDYSLTQAEQVNLSVFNLAGTLVTTLVDGEIPVGNHSAQFDATDLPSGVYIYTMTAGDFVDTRKMVVVK